MAAASRGSGRVDAVTVGNPTAYPAMVDVRGGDWSGWLRLGRVPPESETTIDEVLDAGDRWTFRFSHAGQDEQLTLSRSDLHNRDWRVQGRYPSLTGCSDVASTRPERVSRVDETNRAVARPRSTVPRSRPGRVVLSRDARSRATDLQRHAG